MEFMDWVRDVVFLTVAFVLFGLGVYGFYAELSHDREPSTLSLVSIAVGLIAVGGMALILTELKGG